MLAYQIIQDAARAIASLAPAVSHCGESGLELEKADIERGIQRGYFTPDEDERIRARFAQYLTARAGLLQVIDELRSIAFASPSSIDDEVRLRAMVVAYTASALLVRAGRFIVSELAVNKVIQRKLNEAEPRFGIPRKQFTAIYRSLTSPHHARQLHEARSFIEQRRAEVDALARDDGMATVLHYLHDAEAALEVSKRHFVKSRLKYRWHSLRRRRAAAFGHAMFGIFEFAGRVIADMRNPFHAKRITPTLRRQLEALLRPGDVLVSRHDDALSNLFLPGYWIHASLHIGTEHDRRQMQVDLDDERAARWIGPIRILEARKDGVRFRALDDTLAVDAVAVIRPQLDVVHLADGLSRAVTHEGKLYDFEFDFFRSDRLVCTEVVYRAYHGLGPMQFDLRLRAGRPTLAAEDLLDMAVEERGFEAVAVFGAPPAADALITGARAREALAQSYAAASRQSCAAGSG